MSIKAMGWAWDQNVPAKLKLVLLALADHSDDEGYCWPGVTGVARKCGLSESTVHRGVANLKALGLLRVEPQFRKNGAQATNLYQLVLHQGGCQPDSGGVSGLRQRGGVRTMTPKPLLEPSLEPYPAGASPPGTKREGEKEETVPTPQAIVPTSYEAWLVKVQGAKNKLAALFELAKALWPDFPFNGEYGRLGAMMKGTDAGTLVRTMWRAAADRPSGHPLDYVAGMLRREVKGGEAGRYPQAQPSLRPAEPLRVTVIEGE